MLLGRRTPVTTLLLAAIVAVFVLQTLAGGSTDPEVLVSLGANYPEGFARGEHWRLLASVFLHIGLVHLLLNGWALLQLGSVFELWLGSSRLLVVFLVTGVAGSLASALWTRGLSAGASGAIFGLLGALITFLLRRRDRLNPMARSLLGQLLLWAGINVFIGFTSRIVDNGAHLGGFAAGLLLGLVLRERRLLREPRPEPAEGGLTHRLQ